MCDRSVTPEAPALSIGYGCSSVVNRVRRSDMRITVIGGTGLVGTRLVGVLRSAGHEVVVAARSTGVNSYTGEGLADALARADVLVDVSNSSYTDEEAA